MWGPSRIQFWGRLSSRHSGSHRHARVQTESFDRNFESLCHSCCQTLPGGVSHRVFNASVLPWHRDSGMVALWWPCRAARGGLQVRLRFAAWAARKRAISGPVAPWRGKVVTGSDSGKARRLSPTILCGFLASPAAQGPTTQSILCCCHGRARRRPRLCRVTRRRRAGRRRTTLTILCGWRARTRASG